MENLLKTYENKPWKISRFFPFLGDVMGFSPFEMWRKTSLALVENTVRSSEMQISFGFPRGKLCEKPKRVRANRATPKKPIQTRTQILLFHILSTVISAFFPSLSKQKRVDFSYRIRKTGLFHRFHSTYYEYYYFYPSILSFLSCTRERRGTQANV